MESEERWPHDFALEIRSSSEDNQFKTVYAAFGLAVYYAQVLEAQVLHMAVFAIGTADKGVKYQTLREVEGEALRLTLGQLFARASKGFELPSPVSAAVREAITRRNALVHGYWYEHIGLIGRFEGRIEVARYFEESCQLFRSADQLLEPFVQSALRQWHVTPADIDREYRQLRQELGWDE